MSTNKIQEDIADAEFIEEDEKQVYNVDRPLDIADVVHKVTTVIGDPQVMCGHIAAGTTADYLNASLDTIILDMTIIPVARMLNELDQEDDASSVALGFKQIATTFASLFNKDQRSIEQIMIEKMNKFPIDDVREAYMHREKGTLH